MHNYTGIYLLGPRLSGKTTLGRLVAEKLSWRFVDMDHFIFEETDKTVDQITENGTNWQAFRNIELASLKKLLREKEIVVGCGGGVGVNNIVKHGSNKTYGEIESEILTKQKDILTVVLLPNKDAFRERVTHDETVNSATHRPVLNEKQAESLQIALQQEQDPKRRHALFVAEKIASTLTSYDERQALYEAIGTLLIDTGEVNLEDSAEKIIQALAL